MTFPTSTFLCSLHDTNRVFHTQVGLVAVGNRAAHGIDGHEWKGDDEGKRWWWGRRRGADEWQELEGFIGERGILSGNDEENARDKADGKRGKRKSE
jgi:hypothetical protein